MWIIWIMKLFPSECRAPEVTVALLSSCTEAACKISSSLFSPALLYYTSVTVTCSPNSHSTLISGVFRGHCAMPPPHGKTTQISVAFYVSHILEKWTNLLLLKKVAASGGFRPLTSWPGALSWTWRLRSQTLLIGSHSAFLPCPPAKAWIRHWRWWTRVENLAHLIMIFAILCN